MIKYVYASKNKLSGNFNAPMCHDFPEDAAAEAFTISARETPKEGLAAIKELEVYFLGTYDTKTGLLVAPENGVTFLVDLGVALNGGTSEKES